MDFTSDDSSYRSGQAAKDLGALLQAKLANADGVEWVERSQLRAAEKELKLSAGGLASSSSALHLGKFVKADLLVVGQFVITSPRERTLHLEVIDLERADVLAETSLVIAGVTNQPLVLSEELITAAGEKLRMAMQQALKRRAEVENQPVMAPLFFANTSSSHRLDYLEAELQSALADGAGQRKVRVLQFPRANLAVGESELVVAGLVEQDVAAWQKVADIYIWGQYEEAQTNGVAFAETPVTFTLNFWDGNEEVQTVTEKATVAEIPALKERLAKRMLEAAQVLKRQPSSEKARREVARRLIARACDMQTVLNAVPARGETPIYVTTQGQQMWHYEVKLLGTAHFFLPESYLVHRVWLDRRWFRLVWPYRFQSLGQPPGHFWQRLEQVRSYADFSERFGLITPKDIDQELLPSNYRYYFCKPRIVDGPLKSTWEQAQRMISETMDEKGYYVILGEKVTGFPVDAPAEVLESWCSQISDDLHAAVFGMYETAMQATPPIPVANAHLLSGYALGMKDKEQGVKFLKDIWPAILENPGAGRSQFSEEEFDLFFRRGFMVPVKQLFVDVHRQQEGEAMVEEYEKKCRQVMKITANPTPVSWAKAGVTNSEQPKLVAVNVLPPKLTPALKYVPFPGAMKPNGIVTLKFSDGTLWASTRGGDLMWRDRAWEFLTWPHTNSAVWRRGAGSDAFEALAPNPASHSKVTSFCAEEGRIWMTLEQDGVCSLEPGSGTSKSYGDREGVLSRQMFASALVDGRLFFGGGEINNGKLNYVELPGGAWKSQDLGGGRAQIKLLQPFNHSLLVNDRILDTQNGAWTAIRDFLINEYTPMVNRSLRRLDFDILAATADANDWWLGTTIGLISYNPDTRAAHGWIPVTGGYLVDARTGEPKTASPPTSRIPNGVTAVANDGNFLWVAGTTRFDPLYSGNGSEGRWSGDYFMLTSRPGVCTSSANERHYVLLFHKPTGKWVGYFPVTSRVTSLAVSDEKLWIGLEKTGYIQEGRHSWEDREVRVPSPVIEVQKSAMLTVPADRWVTDQMNTEELNTRIREAVAGVKPALDAEREEAQQKLQEAQAEAEEQQKGLKEREEFVKQLFPQFETVQFQKDTNGDAALQILPPRSKMREQGGSYIFGVKFTVPEWLDGDVKCLYAVSMTAAERRRSVNGGIWRVQQERGEGQINGNQSYQRDSLKKYPQLQSRLPNTGSCLIYSFERSRLEVGKTYAMVFTMLEEDFPDIALSMTINSARGAEECGKLPLR